MLVPWRVLLDVSLYFLWIDLWSRICTVIRVTLRYKGGNHHPFAPQDVFLVKGGDCSRGVILQGGCIAGVPPKEMVGRKIKYDTNWWLYKNVKTYLKQMKQTTVDASEIRLSLVEVGSLSRYLQQVLYISGGCLGFLNHQQVQPWRGANNPSKGAACFFF